MIERDSLCKRCPGPRGIVQGLADQYLDFDTWLALPPNATDHERELRLPLHALRAYHEGVVLSEREIRLRAMEEGIAPKQEQEKKQKQKLTWADLCKLQAAAAAREKRQAAFADVPVSPPLKAEMVDFFTKVRLARIIQRNDLLSNTLIDVLGTNRTKNEGMDPVVKGAELHYRDQLPFWVAKIALEACSGVEEVTHSRLIFSTTRRSCPVLDQN